MAIDVQRIRLDISKQPTQQVVRLGQGDANGTTLECSIYDEGQAYSLTGKTVLLRIQLPGGYAEYHVGGTVSGNVATFQVDEAYAASVAGTTDNAYVEVLQGGTVVCSTSRFRVVVLPSAYEGTDPAHIWDNGITGFLQSANAQVRELTDEAERAISDARAQQAAAAAELDAALDALGDVSELAVPLMSATTRGGAMLGSGLAVSDGRLRTNLVESASGSANAPMSASGDLLHGLTVQGRSVQDGTPAPDAPVEVQVVEGKNLLDASTAAVVDTNKGITYTNNGDGSWTAVGTATANAYIYLRNNASAFTLPAGTYTLSVSDAGGAKINALRLTVGHWVDGSWRQYAVQNGQVTFAHDGTGNVQCTVHVSSGNTVDVTFTVQLEKGSTATSYVPYGSIGFEVQGKNLLPHDVTSQTAGGVTFTLNEDGSVTANGTAVSGGAVLNYLPISGQNITLQAGTYTLSGCPAGGSSSTYKLDINDENDTYRTDYGSGATFTLTNSLMFRRCRIVIYGGMVVSNLTFKPQLERGSTATDYQPYHHTVTPIDLQGNVLASLPDGTHDELTVDALGRVNLVKRVGLVTTDALANSVAASVALTNYVRIACSNAISDNPAPQNTAALNLNGYCNVLPFTGQAYSSDTAHCYANSTSFYLFAPVADKSEWTVNTASEWITEHGVYAYYTPAATREIDLGTIELPKLADGATVEVMASMSTPTVADWWALGAGAVGDGLLLLRDMIGGA